ncbi:MAG: accessory factor UbiK family protein [Burkholderiales bacterium]|nr:accessory factor UbiK family protein [Burkholderiales bacterium]
MTKNGTPLGDIENNIKAIVISVLKKLDIVTREEFDIQQQVLLATRKKLDELESKIDKLVK